MSACKLLVLLCLGILPMWSASAASFDCAKATSPLEKLICENPELDAADSRMGELYKRVSKSFPVKGFVLQTQRLFLSEFPLCMTVLADPPITKESVVQSCLKSINGRISELERYEQARVYGNGGTKFDAEAIVLFVVEQGGKTSLYSWGSWMPNAYDPKPFPDGMLCTFESDLIPVPGGFKVSEDDEALITISDSKINFSSYVVCTARTGGFNGDYPRIR